jgi:hypothetical protein
VCEMGLLREWRCAGGVTGALMVKRSLKGAVLMLLQMELYSGLRAVYAIMATNGDPTMILAGFFCSKHGVNSSLVISS